MTARWLTPRHVHLPVFGIYTPSHSDHEGDGAVMHDRSLDQIQFRRSTVSGGGNCVEVGFAPDGRVVVQNSREPGSSLTFTLTEWDAFLAGVRKGEFDSPAS